MTSTRRGKGGGQKNSPQIADTGAFKVRNLAKIADGGEEGSNFKQFYADFINVWSTSLKISGKSNEPILRTLRHGLTE